VFATIRFLEHMIEWEMKPEEMIAQLKELADESHWKPEDPRIPEEIERDHKGV
jgi:hypothetical protein